ncbi:MAG: O-antigen ligase family protein [Hyphomicrobiales bacterium]|nr:O-antigen ligase family protein [Hyphomicrobiales bacterium]
MESFALYALFALSLWAPDATTAFGAKAELLKYVLFLAVSGLIIVHSYRTRGLAVSLAGDWIVLIAFLSYTALSAFWSEGSTNAFIKAMLVLSAMLVSIGIARMKRMDEILPILYRCLVVFVVLSLIVVILFPDKGIETGWELEGDWRGIAGQKNGLGYISALVLVAALVLPLSGEPGRRWGAWLGRLAIASISAVCLVNSGSRGGLLAAAVGIGSIALAHLPRVMQRVVFLVSIALVVPLVNLTVPTLELTADKIGILGTTINTSNRTTLWFYGLDQLGHRALLGFGIEGFWTPERVQAFKDIYGWVLDNFHNGYITILIEGGVVGILLLLLAVLFVVLLFMVSVGNLKDPYLTLAFGYTNMFLVGNLVENELGRSTSPQFIMFLIIAFALRPYVSRIAGVPEASGLAHPKAAPA